MWEISWNVRGVFFVVVFFLPPPHAGVWCRGSLFDVLEQGEEQSGETQSPEDCTNALPQFLNVIMS